ncbi:MAG: hypothetical protein KGI80_03775 [Verrucomicrobiota bacterium]|nr:hypothetical protein [Verrucomicrobiota bacterium]
MAALVNGVVKGIFLLFDIFTCSDHGALIGGLGIGIGLFVGGPVGMTVFGLGSLILGITVGRCAEEDST